MPTILAQTDRAFDEKDHAEFSTNGYLRLGKLMTPTGLQVLQQRIDDIMLGVIPYPSMRFQLDGASGQYAGLLPESIGHKGSTLAYRRITGLEQDPEFLTDIQHPLIRRISERYIGENVSIFRAMLMNKPAELGTELPWHQDVGEGWGLDRNPIITIWTALDDARIANGCMQVVPGSHQLGVLNSNHYVSDKDQAVHTRPEDIIDLEVEAGEAILLHNWLLHRSGVNSTSAPRRSLSVAYMDADTRAVQGEQTFPFVFGAGSLQPNSPPE